MYIETYKSSKKKIHTACHYTYWNIGTKLGIIIFRNIDT